MKSPREVAVSLSWNYAGRIADATGFYIVGIIVAHTLGVREYGSYALVLSGMQMVVAFSACGFEVALNKFIPGLSAAERGLAIRFLVRRVLVLRCVLAIAVSVAVYCVLGLFTPFDGLVAGLLPFSLFALGRSVVPLLAMGMVAQLRTKVPSIISTVVRGLDVVVVAILSWNGGGLYSFIVALACTSILHAAALSIFVRPSLVGPGEVIPIRPILSFGGIFAINVLVDFVLSRYGDVVLLGLFGNDKGQVGLYEIGAGLVYAAGLVLTTGMAGVNLALFSELVRDGEIAVGRMRNLYQGLVRVLSALTLPLLTFLFLDAETVVRAVYSDRFAGASGIVRAFAAVRIVARLFGGGENTDVLLALGRVGLVSTLGIVAAIMNLVGDVVLIPRYGVYGAVIATSIAYLFVTCGTFVAVRQSLTAHVQVQKFLRFLSGCLVGGFVIFLMPQLSPVSALAVHVPVFALITIGMWMLLKPFTASDLLLVQKVSTTMGSALRVFAPRVDR